MLKTVVTVTSTAQALVIPAPLKELYKTVWEIKQRVLVDMAADRGAFIDQSQSFNVHMSDPNFGKLTSLHFYAWKARRPDARRLLQPKGLTAFQSPMHRVHCSSRFGKRTSLYPFAQKAGRLQVMCSRAGVPHPLSASVT